MNYFDRFLELELKDMLDPVVASPPPRRGRKTSGRPVVLSIATIEGLAAEAIPVVDPAVVTLPVAPARAL